MSTQGIKLTAIADAIREKESTTAAIQANTFADRILALPVGAQNPSVTLPTASTQEEQLARIAAAIRAKERSVGKIPTSEFANRIAALESQTPSRLPSGYTEVEYIHTDGPCWINTQQYAFSKTLKTEMDVYPESNAGYGYFFYQSYSKNALRDTLSLWLSDASIISLCGGYYQQFASSNRKIVEENFSPRRMIVSFDNSKRTVAIDNNSVSFTAFQSAPDSSSSYRLFLLAYNASNYLICKLYSCKMENGGKPVRDFVPCIDPSGAVGLYDLINSVFYANGGTGSFAAGPAV